MHDNLQFAATLIAILGGILVSRQDARRLEAKIGKFAAELRGELGGLRSKVRKDIADLRTEFTRKTDTIAAMLFDHAERLTKLEVGKQ